MKIACISDTHSHHRKVIIPEADVLIHAGDITFRGELPILEDFCNWMKDIPIKDKVVIFGNHELGFQYVYKREKALQMVKDAGLHYLENSSIIINGLNFWGSPVQPWFHDWEWNYQRGKDIAAIWAQIPTDTNVLITHGPPYLIMDEAPRGVVSFENVGCKDLLERLNDLPDLKLHVFGHIHAGYGTKDMGPVKFVNASSCTEKYVPANPPIVVEI
jgi:Icc-related predicted phosphoesterase